MVRVANRQGRRESCKKRRVANRKAAMKQTGRIRELILQTKWTLTKGTICCS